LRINEPLVIDVTLGGARRSWSQCPPGAYNGRPTGIVADSEPRWPPAIPPSTEKTVDNRIGVAHTTENSVHVPLGGAMNDIFFTPRELDVMSILWRFGSATVAEVREALDEDLAYTSVLSALQLLETKGYVTHEAEGRAYRYIPVVEPERAGDSALGRIRDAIFQGSAERMFAHFVSAERLSRAELERMQRMLGERLEQKP
jgi:predicted transcriptional regulator